MASNAFGTLFRITTWGESHGKAIGVVIDGCPAGLFISEEEINEGLSRRAPGKNAYTSPRAEADKGEILSGVFEGKTTGAPISIIIYNRDADSSKYDPIKHLLRPGHANYTYLKKYGIFDYRGGGRSSARETACRVAAGVIAKKLIAHYGIRLVAFIKQIGVIETQASIDSFEELSTLVYSSPIFCPDKLQEQKMLELIKIAKEEGDSVGGIVECFVESPLIGLGDPVYEKLEAKLAKAMMSIPASKGFEIGAGFGAVSMSGSEHNDAFVIKDSKAATQTNHSGGVLGGISTGMPLITRTAFKPTSSIMKPQKTLTLSEEEALFHLPVGSRHDPCVAIRAVPVVEAMTAIVLADALLINRCAKL